MANPMPARRLTPVTTAIRSAAASLDMAAPYSSSSGPGLRSSAPARYPCAIAAESPTLRAQAPRRRIGGWDLGVLVAANAAAVIGLWWRQGGVREVNDVAGLLTSLGRVTGLLGAFLALVQLLLLARMPVLDDLGPERVGAWHRRAGIACLALIAAHTVLITAGYARADGIRAGPRGSATC